MCRALKESMARGNFGAPSPAPASLRGAGRVPLASVSRVCLSWTLSPCASQREDEIEATISISDGLNLVSRHRAARSSPQPGSEQSPPLLEGAPCSPAPCAPRRGCRRGCREGGRWEGAAKERARLFSVSWSLSHLPPPPVLGSATCHPRRIPGPPSPLLPSSFPTATLSQPPPRCFPQSQGLPACRLPDPPQRWARAI